MFATNAKKASFSPAIMKFINLIEVDYNMLSVEYRVSILYASSVVMPKRISLHYDIWEKIICIDIMVLQM